MACGLVCGSSSIARVSSSFRVGSACAHAHHPHEGTGARSRANPSARAYARPRARAQNDVRDHQTIVFACMARKRESTTGKLLFGEKLYV
eukprot:2178299-Pleurochrysis_carterae.AAC.1